MNGKLMRYIGESQGQLVHGDRHRVYGEELRSETLYELVGTATPDQLEFISPSFMDYFLYLRYDGRQAWLAGLGPASGFYVYDSRQIPPSPPIGGPFATFDQVVDFIEPLWKALQGQL